jgi:hypothetical protein
MHSINKRKYKKIVLDIKYKYNDRCIRIRKKFQLADNIFNLKYEKITMQCVKRNAYAVHHNILKMDPPLCLLDNCKVDYDL